MPTYQDESLESNRRRTDKSLHAERARTDESMAEVSKKFEEHTDLAITRSRLKSDDTKSHSRSRFDRLRKAENEDQLSSGSSGALEQADPQLQHERQFADESTENERLRMDSYLEDERELKKTAERELLYRERRETDEAIAYERSEMDAGIRQSAEALIKEFEAHHTTKASLASRDEILAIVSHDLRNPLASISMAAQILTRQPCYSGEDPTAKQFTDMIRRNADEALRLISDLLDLEHITQGKSKLELKVHDLNEIAEQTVRMFEPLAAPKSISLQLVLSQSSTFAFCDHNRVSQVMGNLIGNAIKFTQAGGTVTVSVQSLEKLHEITVADNGPGIQADMREKIFERFSQIDKDDRRGLGLGLYISKMIIEAHGGRIWVDSELGCGSTFHFTLPKGKN
jgi:signal transduction histidine kinase